MKIDVTKVETVLATRGLSKTELAKRSGIYPQNISAILRRGVCEPRTAGKLAAGLDVSVSEIIKEEGAE